MSAAELAGVGRTKAESLAWLREVLGPERVPALLWFAAEEWRRRPGWVLARLRAFPHRRLALRSSAMGEDGLGASLAGHYVSRLDVANDEDSLRNALEAVTASLDGAGDQILVQRMVSDVREAGVVFSRDPRSGGPYFQIERDVGGGRTDRVTSGASPSQRVFVLRGAERRTEELRPILDATCRVERALGAHAIDVEYAVPPHGPVQVLQARGLALEEGDRTCVDRDQWVRRAIDRLRVRFARRSAPDPDAWGERTILSQMADWNPAELIGTHPKPLARSLFGHLITDRTWSKARADLGYRAQTGALVDVLAGRPFVDVRASLNSFLPAALPAAVGRRVIDQAIHRLSDGPERHDRLEFEVSDTVVDFSFSARRARNGTRLDDGEQERVYRQALLALTNRLVSAAGPLASSLRAVAGLEARRDVLDVAPSLAAVLSALDTCRDRGAVPFAQVARHAFIAESLLRSAVEREALSEERAEAFRASVETVLGELRADLASVHRGAASLEDWLTRYGHLRPGTFDVTSRPYRDRMDLFAGASGDVATAREPFCPRPEELRRLDGLAKEAGLVVGGAELFRYAKAAIWGREHAKFVFSRSLSASLEALVAWGVERGFSREDLAHLERRDFEGGDRVSIDRLRRCIQERRALRCRERWVRLPPVVRQEDDLLVVREVAVPTFVTRQSVVARPCRVGPQTGASVGIDGQVVCIESADPGFDWIFTRRPCALVTRWGGANSHMAIRCREAGLPAALGVGEQRFEHIVAASQVELQCGEGVVRCV